MIRIAVQDEVEFNLEVLWVQSLGVHCDSSETVISRVRFRQMVKSKTFWKIAKSRGPQVNIKMTCRL